MDDYISPTEPVQALAVQRAAPLPWARIGLLGVGVAALVAAAILAFGSTATPKDTLAAGTTVNGSTIVEDLNGFGGRGGPGFGHGFGGITITAISGSSISLRTADGWTRTITVDSGTTYSRSGDTLALADLKVGDQVGFRQTREDDGSFTIDSIAVIPPHLGGEVTAVAGSTITVKQRDGSTGTIKVTADTTFEVAGADAALADIKVGMFLVAEGTENSDGSLTATDVHAGTPGERGPGGRGFHMGSGGFWDGVKPG
jgi:hypothetical protein